jgi:hypothetical protein
MAEDTASVLETSAMNCQIVRARVAFSSSSPVWSEPSRVASSSFRPVALPGLTALPGLAALPGPAVLGFFTVNPPIVVERGDKRIVPFRD